jgi:uncharacterized protein
MSETKTAQKTIWIDLGNSPHVLFFDALAREFLTRGHTVLWTARDYAQTVPLARKRGIDAAVIGRHGGKNVVSKLFHYVSRIYALWRWAHSRQIDLVISHSSQEPLAVARILGLPSVNIMDYEHHPANHLSFRMAKRLIVPRAFPDEALRRFGVGEDKVRRFDGIKEDVYLAEFEPDDISAELAGIGIRPKDILVVVRPHASDALYHRRIANELLSAAIDRFAAVEGCKIILLPRTARQASEMSERHRQSNVIVPAEPLDGRQLVAAADLVISGGGTMNREAAALGVPTVTVFAGTPAAIDEYLIREGCMQRISSIEDLEALLPRKKEVPEPRRERPVRSQVADLILEDL